MKNNYERGIIHLIVPILVFALFAAIGALMLLSSHASPADNPAGQSQPTANPPASTPSK